MRIQNKIFLLFTFYLLIIGTTKMLAQSGTVEPKTNVPVAPSVYEFTKYGNVPVNEYRGLANISIPLYSVNVDDASLPLTLSYFSGGIKVTEEAGIVGLGWSLNLPTVIQTIKSKNDYDNTTVHQKLPPFQGNPAIPSIEIYKSDQGLWNVDTCCPVSLPGVQVNPYYANVLDYPILIDSNGYYNTNGSGPGKYLYMFGNYLVDTEPDIFSVNINGDEIKFCRTSSTRTLFDNSTYELLPVVVINGRNDYKVELITTNIDPVYNMKISGFKITDPSGNQYFFNKIEKVFYNGWGKPTNINYKLTKIISNKGKEITFNYSAAVAIAGLNILERTYLRKTSSTANTYAINKTGEWNAFDNGYFDDSFNDQEHAIIYGSLDNLYNLQDYYFLESIVTPNEKVLFSYGTRVDYLNMKKLNNIEIQSLYNLKVKKYSFNYDYFVAASGYTTYPIITTGSNTLERSQKRLKLLSVIEEGNPPYSFEYDAIALPQKNSYSIDYWGFHNGFNNSNLNPDFTDLGYPAYTDNVNNNFNSNLTYARAGSLKKIIYPTKGYAIFNFELHQFDNLLYNTGSVPVIGSGAGLRISDMTNYNHTGAVINKQQFTYTGGKCIAKKVLTKTGNDYWIQCIGEEGDGGMIHMSTTISATLGNFVSQSNNSQGDYIGYDNVVIKDVGIINNGKTEKIFQNKENTIINPASSLFPNASSYTLDTDYENGKLLDEKIRNSTNDIIKWTQFTYTQKIFNQSFYGMSLQNNGVRVVGRNTADTGCYGNLSIYAKLLSTFYPISGKTTFLKEKIITEYFPSGSVVTKSVYTFNSRNLLESTIVSTPFEGTISNESVVYSNDPIHISKNMLNIPISKTIVKKGSSNATSFEYETLTNSVNLVKSFTILNTDSSTKRTTLYNLHDTNNNPTQYLTENGIYHVIIWGYNKSLPIAIIENASYANINSMNLEVGLQTQSNSNDEASLLVLLTAFRTQLATSFPKATLVTYTHKPGVGVSTITDQAGNKSTFTYDVSGKLLTVKDQQNNLVSENAYNYKP